MPVPIEEDRWVGTRAGIQVMEKREMLHLLEFFTKGLMK
jgi:hypothetical protein